METCQNGDCRATTILTHYFPDRKEISAFWSGRFAKYIESPYSGLKNHPRRYAPPPPANASAPLTSSPEGEKPFLGVGTAALQPYLPQTPEKGNILCESPWRFGQGDSQSRRIALNQREELTPALRATPDPRLAPGTRRGSGVAVRIRLAFEVDYNVRRYRPHLCFEFDPIGQ